MTCANLLGPDSMFHWSRSQVAGENWERLRFSCIPNQHLNPPIRHGDLAQSLLPPASHSVHYGCLLAHSHPLVRLAIEVAHSFHAQPDTCTPPAPQPLPPSGALCGVGVPSQLQRRMSRRTESHQHSLKLGRRWLKVTSINSKPTLRIHSRSWLRYMIALQYQPKACAITNSSNTVSCTPLSAPA